MKTTLLTLMTGTLIASGAFAQTPATIENQVTMTRDYAQNLLNKIGNVPQDRFNQSHDYSKIGPKLNNAMKVSLDEFRSAMETVMIGSLVDSINSYNDLVKNTTLPDAARQTAIKLQASVLDQQSRATTAVYQNELKRLYSFIPELTAKEFFAKDKKHQKVYLRFADGSEEFFEGYSDDYQRGISKDIAETWNRRFSTDNHEENSGDHPSYTLRLDHFIKSVCQTRTCAGGVLQQLTSYLLYVQTYLDRDLSITLANGKVLTINRLYGGPGFLPSAFLLKAVLNFTFDETYANLPLKN
jgi:hypothetical protein